MEVGKQKPGRYENGNIEQLDEKNIEAVKNSTFEITFF